MQCFISFSLVCEQKQYHLSIYPFCLLSSVLCPLSFIAMVVWRKKMHDGTGVVGLIGWLVSLVSVFFSFLHITIFTL